MATSASLVGEPGAERDQVVLGGQLGLLELPLPAPGGWGGDQKKPERPADGDDPDDDQDIAQRVGGALAAAPAEPSR
jgi:hypothetical protein